MLKIPTAWNRSEPDASQMRRMLFFDVSGFFAQGLKGLEQLTADSSNNLTTYHSKRVIVKGHLIINVCIHANSKIVPNTHVDVTIYPP